jgi:hypothetical protein
MSGSLTQPFDAEQLRADLEVDRGDLNNSFLTQAGLFSFYAEQHARMMRQEGAKKLALEVIEAKLDKALRDEAASNNVKVTEKQIEQAIARNADYIRAAHAYNEARALTELAKGAVEAFRQRRDMLIQLGANDRHDMKGELRMRVQDELRDRMGSA